MEGFRRRYGCLEHEPGNAEVKDKGERKKAHGLRVARCVVRGARCGVRVAGCAAEGALRFRSTSLEERSFGTRDFFPQAQRSLNETLIERSAH